jgi:hypothetical protein
MVGSPDFLRLLAGFFTLQRQFDARCRQLLDAVDGTPDEIRTDLVALFAENRVHTTLKNLQALINSLLGREIGTPRLALAKEIDGDE